MALLLSKGADVQRCLRGGGTCLHVAVRREHAAAAKTLLAHGADPDAADVDGETSLELAERLALPDMVACLVHAAVGRTVDKTLEASRSRDEVRAPGAPDRNAACACSVKASSRRCNVFVCNRKLHTI